MCGTQHVHLPAAATYKTHDGNFLPAASSHASPTFTPSLSCPVLVARPALQVCACSVLAILKEQHPGIGCRAVALTKPSRYLAAS